MPVTNATLTPPFSRGASFKQAHPYVWMFSSIFSVSEYEQSKTRVAKRQPFLVDNAREDTPYFLAGLGIVPDSFVRLDT
jgi:hypothetical protein